MPGAELDLPGPRYEPLSGSVGESDSSVPAPTPSASSPPLVPSVDPANSPSDDSDSDSASEPDLDDSDDAPFVPTADVLPDVPSSPSPSPESTPEPSPSPGPSPSPSPDARDSKTPPAPSQPYTTCSGRPSRPVGQWWKVNHPYQQARDNRQTRHSGRTPESAALAVNSEIAALEEANAVRALSDSELIEYAFLTSGSEPRTYAEAMNRDDAGLWQEASQQEYDALMQHGVWELCELPKGRKAVGCRWVYRIKMNTAGSVERYKA